MLDKITLPFVFAYILPPVLTTLLILISLSFRIVRDALFISFPSNPLREVRWGLFQIFLAITFFFLGFVLAMLSIYELPFGGRPAMIAGIIGLTIGVFLLIYTIWLGIHYYNSKKEDKPILIVTRDTIEINTEAKMENNRTIINTDKYVIEISNLAKEGDKNASG